MSDRDAYIALVSSLPSSERLFASKLPPLSRLRLEKRLSALTLSDRATLAQIEDLLRWRSYGMAATSDQTIVHTKALLSQVESETLRNIVVERMDLRTVIAALRMRKRGDGVPTKAWGPSRLTGHIIANWSDPAFKLSDRLPWVPNAISLLDSQDPLGLERHLLEVTFRQLKQHAGAHLFDFEAVVIYVLKWNIFDRWARSDARAATHRFETMAQAALGDFAELTLEGV